MDILVSVILPIFGIMAAGFLATFTSFFDDSARRGLAQFVFYFAIPVMLFHSLATSRLPERFDWGLYIAFYGGALLTFMAGLPLFGLITGAPIRTQVMCGFGTIYGNVILIGIPVILSSFVEQAGNEEAAVVLFLLVSFHSTILYVFITILVEGWSRTEGDWRSLPWRVVKSLITNPIVIAILAGVFYARSGLHLPELVDRFAELFGQAAIPSALFSVGASLAGYKIAGKLPLVAAITSMKIIIMPFAVWLLGSFVFVLEPVYLAVAVTIAAMPAGVNTYLFAVRYQQSEAEIAASVLLSTLLSIPILTFLLAHFVPQLGL